MSAVDEVPRIPLVVNGQTVHVPDDGRSLLDVLREELGLVGAKDGCSPQGQCGCCTVLVDGSPRVACVTPARRVRDRSVVTIEGLDDAVAQQWADAFCSTGASQCGFCTPGIIMRLEGLRLEGLRLEGLRLEGLHSAVATGAAASLGRPAVDHALLAHLCRCTGWQTIIEAWEAGAAAVRAPQEVPVRLAVGRDLDAASARAGIEGHGPQVVSPAVALGAGGFAADSVPPGALRAVPDGLGGWATGLTLAEARRSAGKRQGRRTTLPVRWPLEVPDGPWVATLSTTWVEPAYLETDASWCVPGGEPVSPVANGGAFGAKATIGEHRSPVMAAARRLADEHGVAVLALAGREDTVRWGPKRPPVAGGVDESGRGRMRIVATPGVAARIHSVAPGIEVEEIEVVGPPTSASIRAAGWAEAAVLLAAAAGQVGTLRAPNGAEARAELMDGVLRVEVRCGRPLDEVMLRSYCIGAAHMAYSWVTSEALTLDDEGRPDDLTIRSFGIVRSADMPLVEVSIEPDDTEPVNGSDAVFAAVAAATWMSRGCPTRWPVGATVPTSAKIVS